MAAPGRTTWSSPSRSPPKRSTACDAEIRSVFKPGEVIVPDDVRGSHKTLEEAVLAGGWPSLESARGKVVFLLDQKRVTPLYTEGHPSLEGRVLFTNATPGTPDAAFVETNDPLAAERFRILIRKGYIVRTMSDPGVEGVKTGAKPSRRDQALASGARRWSAPIIHFSKKRLDPDTRSTCREAASRAAIRF